MSTTERLAEVPAPPPSAAAALGLASHRTWVDDRAASYGVGGEGVPVVFLHGWLLGHRSYRQAAERLIQLGCRVYAPSLPGFGGTADLRGRRFSLSGYGHWVDDFCEAVGIDEPVFLVGHSFGGGVAIKVAHDHPDRVRSVVLVDSIGGAAWKLGTTVRRLAERPLWDWGFHVRNDFWPLGQAARVIPAMLEDAVPNLVRNPLAVLRVSQLARSADLSRELAVLRERRTPVTVLWGVRDGLIPQASFDAMCLALGSDGQVVEGSHSWPLADPDAFGEHLAGCMQLSPRAS